MAFISEIPFQFFRDVNISLSLYFICILSGPKRLKKRKIISHSLLNFDENVTLR
jgi:hypothetical protein